MIVCVLALVLVRARGQVKSQSISRGQHLLRRGFEFRLAGDMPVAITYYTRAIEAEPTLLDVSCFLISPLSLEGPQRQSCEVLRCGFHVFCMCFQRPVPE